MTENNKNPTHWKSGLMSVNPERLREYPAAIETIVYDETEGHSLYLSIRRLHDSLLSTLQFTYDYWDIPASVPFTDLDDPPLHAIDKSRLPQSIRLLYEDFNVDGYSQFANQFENFGIIGVYYDVKVLDKPRTSVRGHFEHPKVPNKPRTLVRGKTQGLFDLDNYF